MKTAYRSYLICRNGMTGAMWVEKGGVYIQTVKDVEEARGVIDSLMA